MNFTKIKGLEAFLLIILVFGLANLATSTQDLPPSPIFKDSSATGGLAFYPGDEIDNRYSPPWDVYNDDKMILTFSSYSTDLDEKLEVEVVHKGGLVYRHGYIFENGKWNIFNLAGNRIKGTDWLKNTGSTNIEANNPGETFVVAYSCKKVQGEWKCGCDESFNCEKWMIQSFETSSCIEKEVSCINNSVAKCKNNKYEITEKCSSFENCQLTCVGNNCSRYIGSCEIDIPEDPDFCGDDFCGTTESLQTCPQDCNQDDVCGNEIVDDGEECDGPVSCQELGYESGEATCNKCEINNECYTCGDGICSEYEKNKCDSDCLEACYDSDGNNILTPGYVSQGIQSWTDTCVFFQGQDNRISEQICENGKKKIDVQTCPEEKPYCRFGQCTEINVPTCTDSDGGIELKIKGKAYDATTFNDIVFQDVCLQDMNIVENCENCEHREFYCTEEISYVNFKTTQCSSCQDGKCLD